MEIRKMLGLGTLATMLALAGCSSSTDDGEGGAVRGVRGRLVSSAEAPAPARVAARSIDGAEQIEAAAVAADGTFRLELPTHERYELTVLDEAGGERDILVFEGETSAAFEAARAALLEARAMLDDARGQVEAAIAAARAMYEPAIRLAEAEVEAVRATGSADAIAEAEATLAAARAEADAAEAAAREDAEASLRSSEEELARAEAELEAARAEVDTALSEVLALSESLGGAAGDLDLGALVETGGDFIADDDGLGELDWDEDTTADPEDPEDPEDDGPDPGADGSEDTEEAGVDEDGDGVPDGI